MDFICPNCAKMISVPDQFAGQMMKCPLCQQTFQSPSLPSSAPVAAEPLNPVPEPQEEEVYKFSPEPPPPAPPSYAPPPAPSSPRVEPARPQAKASAPPPPPPPSSPSLSTAGYARKFSIQLNPQVLMWVPAVALFLIFMLTFFNWVGMYPGGVSAVTQSAWQAAFGSYTLDPVYAGDLDKFDKAKDEPGWSVLTLFYLLSFLPVFLVTVAVLAATQLKIQLPPQIQQIWQWRYLIVAALTLIPLFFLLLQGLAGFPLESKQRDNAASKFAEQRKAANTEDKTKKVNILEGEELAKASLRRTSTRTLVVVLQLLASIGALLAFWVERRGPGRPLPRVEALW
jgi:hypothetical protein